MFVQRREQSVNETPIFSALREKQVELREPTLSRNEREKRGEEERETNTRTGRDGRDRISKRARRGARRNL